jgi:hypothetical protein
MGTLFADESNRLKQEDIMANSHAVAETGVARLKLIWFLDFGILDGASSRRLLQLRSPHLELALKQEVFDMGNCARRYWQLDFPAIGWSASRRDRKENTAPNRMLNYGQSNLIENTAASPQFLRIHTRRAATALRKDKCYEPEPKFAWQN